MAQSKQSRYSAQKTAEKAEIGDIPAIVNPARRARCAESLEAFCLEYFPDLFYLRFGEVHKKLINDVQDTIKRGELKAVALPRSSGKTTICQVGILWAILYGFKAFGVLIAAETGRAAQLLTDIRIWLETNEKLLEDFPEVTYPFWKLEGISQRARIQTYNGEKTRIEINAGRIVFPAIPLSLAYGARLFATGLTSSGLRGLGAVTADGRKIRPDLVLVDDPSTAESARSDEQNNTRERLIKADVLGMAGAGKKISCLVTCTVIEENDLALRLLDRQRNPEFKGTRVSLMPSLPNNLAIWREYYAKRIESIEAGNEFYKQHRSEMDDGASVSWPDRYNPDEISAIQSGMNLYLRDPESFNTEYQNKPAEPKDEVKRLTPSMVRAVWTSDGFYDDAPWVSFKTASIDVHKDLLYWSVMGWANDFRGQVLAYGAYPDQRRKVFNKKDVTNTIKDNDGALISAIIELIGQLRDYTDIQLIGVDVGYKQTVTQTAISRAGGKVFGLKGVFYGAKSRRQINDFSPSSSLTIGNHWNLKRDGRNSSRTFFVDTNYWKSRLFEGIESQTVSINGDDGDIKQLTSHLCAERAVLVRANNSEVYEWEQVRSEDNHLLDTIIYNHVLASAAGARAPSDVADIARRSMYREQRGNR